MSSFDSALESQRLFSQSNDHSQASTQDLFTPLSGSQNERNCDRTSMYEKWLSKRSIFKQSNPGENKTGSLAPCTSQRPVLNQTKLSTSIYSTPHLFNSQPKKNDGLAHKQQSLKNKAYERDERDFLEQIASNVQENNREMKGITQEMRDEMEKLGSFLREEMLQATSASMDCIRKFQDDLQSSLSNKEKILSEIDDLQKVNNKKDQEIASLQADLQNADKIRKEEFDKIMKAILALKSQPEQVLKRIQDVSEKTGQVYQNLNVFKETIEAQNEEYHNLAKSTSSFVREMEKRMMKVLKKLESDMTTNKGTREIVEICFENCLIDLQQLLQRQLDAFSKKSKIDVKDAMSQENKKILETCLRKHLKTVCDKLEEISQMSCKDMKLQESFLQAVEDCGFEKIKTSVEECKTTFEKETSLLKQIDERLKNYTENLHHERTPETRNQREPSFSSCRAYENTVVPEIQSSRSLTETGNGRSYLNRDYGRPHQRERTNRKEYLPENQTKPASLDISYQTHQNNSFSSQDHYIHYPTSGKNDFQFLSQQTSIPVVDEYVETKKLVLRSNRGVPAISPYKSPDQMININPSPLATVRSQRRINQTRDLWQENVSGTSHINMPREDLKYDLRKRKINEESNFSRAWKEAKLDRNMKENKSNSIKQNFGHKSHENVGSLSGLENYDKHKLYSNVTSFKCPLMTPQRRKSDMRSTQLQRSLQKLKEATSSSTSYLNRYKDTENVEENHTSKANSEKSSPAFSIMIKQDPKVLSARRMAKKRYVDRESNVSQSGVLSRK